MSDEFENLPPSIGALDSLKEHDKRVKKWKHELEVKFARLEKELSQLLNRERSGNADLLESQLKHTLEQIKKNLGRMGP